MNPFLSKTLELFRRIVHAFVTFIGWIVTLLRSVNIDQQRAVLLCVALQLVTIGVFLVGLRTSVESPARSGAGAAEPTLEPTDLNGAGESDSGAESR